MGEIVSKFAHEANQSLSAILINAEAAQRLLRVEEPDLGELEAGLREIGVAGREACAVIDRLCTQVRKAPARCNQIAADQLVGGAVDLAWADLWARGVLLHAKLAPDLPPVAGDASRLQQVILNLIVNACDAMASVAPEERLLTIESRLSAAGDAVELDVADRGTGIREDDLERIFEPFHARKANGLGLDLAVGRSVVRALRGRLWAANNPGAGATFHLVLPVAGEASKVGESTP